MRILIFTEGTILAEGIQGEERKLALGSVYDFANYIPISNAVEKITSWEKQGANIYYLTSRKTQREIDIIQQRLEKFNFPDCSNLYYRQQGEDYKDVAERVMPDILIEDDCASIGGEIEMTYPHINSIIQSKIKSIVVKEFSGIDHLSDKLSDLMI